jgi:hypothetical protein
MKKKTVSTKYNVVSTGILPLFWIFIFFGGRKDKDKS